MKQVDINCDVGEGQDNEELIFPLISSCNIACGGHAGDQKTVERVVNLALQHHLKIGAHPSYPDKENFGRKTMEMGLGPLSRKLIQQINIVQEVVEAKGSQLHHIKLHGALYNDAAKNVELATMVVDTIFTLDKNIILYAPYNSVLLNVARGKLKTAIEGFADRAYNADYSLVSRSENNAVLTDPETVLKHILLMIQKNQLKTLEGPSVPFFFDTLCIHSDTENAVQILRHLHKEFENRNIKIA